MRRPLGPTDFADVQQALQTLLDLQEYAELDGARHPAADAVARVVTVLQTFPRVRLHGFQTQRNALSFRVELDHFAADRLADFHDVGRIVDAAVGKIGDVE